MWKEENCCKGSKDSKKLPAEKFFLRFALPPAGELDRRDMKQLNTKLKNDY